MQNDQPQGQGRARGIPIPLIPAQAGPLDPANAGVNQQDLPALQGLVIAQPPAVQPYQEVVRQHIFATTSMPQSSALDRLPFYKLDFGRQDSIYHYRQLIVNINDQTSLFTTLYEQLQQLTTTEPPITQDQFIRMCRTLLLKRVQDIYEKCHRIRAPNYIQIDRGILIPGPVGDLLYVLGRYHSTNDGAVYVLSPPPRAAAAENWWAIDNDILGRYLLYIDRLSDDYIMYEFPKPTDYDNRPICRTTINDFNNDYRSVRAHDSGVTPNDAFIRFVNDDLFIQNEYINYDRAALQQVSERHRPTVQRLYVNSYISGSSS